MMLPLSSALNGPKIAMKGTLVIVRETGILTFTIKFEKKS